MHLRSVSLFLVLFLLGGCSKEPAMTYGQWLKELSLSAGFSQNEKTALEDLKSFDLIEWTDSELDMPLNALMVRNNALILCDDIDFVNQLVPAHSDQKLSHSQAKTLLKQLVHQMNDFAFEEKTELSYVNPVIQVNVLDECSHRFLIDQTVNAGDLVEMNHQVYKVQEVEGNWITVKDVSFEDVENIDLSGSISFSPDQMSLIVKGNVEEVNELPGAGLPVLGLSRSFDVSGFSVRISSSSDSLHIYVSKKMMSGQPIFAQFDINKIHCDFKWKMEQKKVEAAAFKVNVETAFQTGLRNSVNQNKVLDFSKLDKNQILDSLKTALVVQDDCLLDTVELAEIQLPFPQFPMCTLKMKVLLYLYASGRAEIGFTSDHVFGFEMINDKLRMINETEKENQFSARASAKISTMLQFVLAIMDQNCMDAAVEMGIQSDVVTKLRFDDDNVTVDMPYEATEELAKDSAAKVCADLNAYWMLNLILNSSQTLLGRLGLNQQINLINANNGSLFGKSVHLENFQIVERCTRNSVVNSDLDVQLHLDRIELKNYLIILEENGSQLIEISAMPFGYSRNDVMYSSSDDHVATVTSSGKVNAHHSGNAIVQVKMKDGSYEAQCSVFVR